MCSSCARSIVRGVRGAQRGLTFAFGPFLGHLGGAKGRSHPEALRRSGGVLRGTRPVSFLSPHPLGDGAGRHDKCYLRRMKPPRTVASDYAERRARIGARLPADAVLVLSGGVLHTRSNDTEHRFRPDSSFHYLTGLSAPESVLVIRGGASPSSALFVQEKDRAAEIWSGRRPGPEGAKQLTQVEDAYPISSLDSLLCDLLHGAREVHIPIHRDDALRERVLRASRAVARGDRSGAISPTRLVDADVIMGEERLLKDEAALASLRHAVALSALGHREAAAHLRPGSYEYEFEARLEYAFRRNGSTGPGYGSIVGAGDNANILHYVENSAEIQHGDLLLVDAGCEWEFFTGDITRCYPASGTFSPAQKAVYEVVLAANLAGVEASTVGGNINAIHTRCLDVLVDGMLELGLLSGSKDAVLEREEYKRFYMHRTSHWLGVDVHDVGTYSVDGTPRPLEVGHVLTVEPGLYIANDLDGVPDEFRGIGVRIEDDVWVTAQGPTVLSDAAPKTISDVEALVGSAL